MPTMKIEFLIHIIDRNHNKALTILSLRITFIY